MVQNIFGRLARMKYCITVQEIAATGGLKISMNLRRMTIKLQISKYAYMNS